MANESQLRGPGRPPAAQGPDVRSALLEAARACIVELGYAAASTKDIAQRAGVNPAMINYYFGGKAALAEACFRDTIEPLRRRLDALAEAGAGGGRRAFHRVPPGDRRASRGDVVPARAAAPRSLSAFAGRRREAPPAARR